MAQQSAGAAHPPGERPASGRMAAGTELRVCRDGELAEGAVRIVALGEVEIGVFRHGGGYVAYRNLCPHQGGPACEGVLMPKVAAVLGPDQSFRRHAFDESEMHVVCPWHGWEFRLADGSCAGDPRIRLRRHEVVVRDGEVLVRV